MAEKDDKGDKEPRKGTANPQAERETRGRQEHAYSASDRDDEDYARDYDSRARRDIRDLGDSVRDTGRRAQRAGSDLLTSGCDAIGNFFIGLGEAISPRRRGRSRYDDGGYDDYGRRGYGGGASASNCADELSDACNSVGRYGDCGNYGSRDRSYGRQTAGRRSTR